MAKKIAIHPESDYDKFFESLHSAIPTDFRYLLQYVLDELRPHFDSLSHVVRLRYITFLRDTIIELWAASFENYVRQRDGSFNPVRRSNVTLDFPLNDGASGTQFQHQLLEASDAAPPGHDGAAYPKNGAAGNPFSCNTDMAISIDCFPTPSGPRASCARTLGKVTISLKEFLDFFKGNPELARDDPTWFTTLLGINGSVIALIASTRNSPQSLPIKIMESFTSICAIVGFCVSLAGLYLLTYKPMKLPFGFGFDPEVSTQNMGIARGIATVVGFVAGVLLLLPSHPPRWIIMGLACATFIIPILIKLWRSFSGADIDLPDSI